METRNLSTTNFNTTGSKGVYRISQKMSEKWKQNADSLVEYDIPMLVKLSHNLMAFKIFFFASIKLKGSQPGGAEASGSDAEILHALLPPKEWVQDGQTWIQKVSQS
jgi:hypothetical protein